MKRNEKKRKEMKKEKLLAFKMAKFRHRPSFDAEGWATGQQTRSSRLGRASLNKRPTPGSRSSAGTLGKTANV